MIGFALNRGWAVSFLNESLRVMRSQISYVIESLLLCSGVLLRPLIVPFLVALTTPCAAQNAAPRAHLQLPPAYGATVLSTYINAQAAYIAALGDFLESEAIARRHHAAAAEHEMRNSLLWVQTYFERKELNRAYRRKQDPNYLDRQDKQKERATHKLYELPQVAMEGDIAHQLNWLLHEVAASTTAHQLLPGAAPLIASNVDEQLAAGDADHIRLTDGGHRNGQLLVFRASDPRLLETRWPRALRDPEFAAVRAEFEGARDVAIRELRGAGHINFDAERRLTEAVDGLSTAFTTAWPRTRATKSSDTFTIYVAGKNYLRALAAGVCRLLETSDTRLFDGAYEFKGDSLVELVNHLCQYGLEFAPPQPGDEGAYRKLFFAMRNLYFNLEGPPISEK